MEYVSQTFADSVKMWAGEQMIRNGHKYISETEAFNTLFSKYEFKYRDHERFDSEILSWKNIPWLHNVLNHIFTHCMGKNDALNASVKVIATRDDGITLGYIESLTVALDVNSIDSNEEEEFCIEDFEATYDIEHDDMPRLVVFTDKSLTDNHYLYFATNSDDNLIDSEHMNESFRSDAQQYNFSFYKKHDNSAHPSYHYWEEQ